MKKKILHISELDDSPLKTALELDFNDGAHRQFEGIELELVDWDGLMGEGGSSGREFGYAVLDFDSEGISRGNIDYVRTRFPDVEIIGYSNGWNASGLSQDLEIFASGSPAAIFGYVKRKKEE